MRRFFSVLFLLIVLNLCSLSADAKSDLIPKIKFGKNQYSLYYSVKNNETNGYMNEYYKQGETYTSWSELLTVQHMPNSFSPIEQANTFRDYLGELMIPSAIDIDEENNSAILDFVMISSKRRPVIVEYNVFKYVKNPVCGTSLIQYARRYVVPSPLEVEYVKKELNKSRLRYVKMIQNFTVPDVVCLDMDKGVYLNDENKQEENIVFPEIYEDAVVEFFKLPNTSNIVDEFFKAPERVLSKQEIKQIKYHKLIEELDATGKFFDSN